MNHGLPILKHRGTLRKRPKARTHRRQSQELRGLTLSLSFPRTNCSYRNDSRGPFRSVAFGKVFHGILRNTFEAFLDDSRRVGARFGHDPKCPRLSSLQDVIRSTPCVHSLASRNLHKVRVSRTRKKPYHLLRSDGLNMRATPRRP